MRISLPRLSVLIYSTLLGILGTGCGGGHRPDPVPSPSPTPPPVSDMGPLRPNGPYWLTPGGRFVALFGAVICCDAPDTPFDDAKVWGWPLIEREPLELFARHKLHYTHIRLGPFTPYGEGNRDVAYLVVDGEKVDLNQWSPPFWERVRNVLRVAQALGIYVEVDLVDGWVLKHREDPRLSPWRRTGNIQGYDGGYCSALTRPPDAVQETWLRKVFEVIKDYPNAILQDGNEHFDCNPQPSAAWFRRVMEIKREMGVPHVLCTNSHVPEIEALADCVERHEESAPAYRGKPTMVNEYPSTNPAEFTRRALQARERGVIYHLWRGAMTGPEFAAALQAAKVISEGGTPEIPGPPPLASCPPLVQWSCKLHNSMTSGYQPIPRPIVGGRVVLDSTPRFRLPGWPGGRGGPCNSEHPCGRECESPEGAVWTQVRGPSVSFRPQQDNYQIRVDDIPATGVYEFQACPHIPLFDGEQPPKPVGIIGDGCGRCSFEVRP